MAVMIKYDIRDVPLEEVAADHATLTAAGIGINKQVEQLTEKYGYSFTRTQIERLKTKDIYMTTFEQYQKNIVKKAISDAKLGISGLIPKALKALEAALDDGSVAAIALAFKAIGMENMEAENKQAQSITVILPGQKKQIKDVTNGSDK